MKLTRRPLRFTSLADVMPDVERCLVGHRTVGNWSLGQICSHLATAITISLEGSPVQAPWLVRRTVGPVIFRGILLTGRIPRGVVLPEKYIPQPGQDARASADSLRAALQAFSTHTGPLREHPFGGWISRRQWEKFHCIHCAHHLSFVLPVDNATTTVLP